MPSHERPHSLPKKNNPVLEDAPPVDELVESRRIGLTELGRDPSERIPFSYVHLRVALPRKLGPQELFGPSPPETYFLMRRCKDGFVSATGMFKAAYPWAKKDDEDVEKGWIKGAFKRTSNEETAGNLWVHPQDALTLSEEYGIKPFVVALLDPAPCLPSDGKAPPRDITPPPVYNFNSGDMSEAESVSSSLAPPSTRRRSTRSRSASPVKRTPRRGRTARTGPTPLKKQVANEESTVTTTKVEEKAVLSETIPSLTNGKSSTDSGASLTTPERKPIKFEVDEAVETNGDVEVKTTHIKMEGALFGGEPTSPETTADMLKTAKEMVAESQRLQLETPGKTLKRGADDLEEDEEDDVGVKNKKVKMSEMIALEEKLRREKTKSRIMTGLAATFAITMFLPYVL